MALGVREELGAVVRVMVIFGGRSGEHEVSLASAHAVMETLRASGRYEVIPHADFLLDLVRQGRLIPTRQVSAKVTYHDSCYLGRYNDIYESPREVLSRVNGLRLVEPTETRDRGMCCSAGGAGFWGAIVTLLIAAVVLLLSDRFLSGMEVKGFVGAIVAAIAMAVVGWLLYWLLGVIGLT